MTRTKLRAAVRAEAIADCIGEIETMRAHQDALGPYSLAGILAIAQGRLQALSNASQPKQKGGN